MSMGHARYAVALAAVLAVVAVVAAGAAVPLAAQQPRSRCVECHARQPDVSSAGHGFAAWRASRHGAANVGCEACHGGDAAATDQTAAHRGVRRSTDRQSGVFFQRVPDTCGRCHASEAGYFRSSVHYGRLRADGHGPNCVTCHGAMATAVLTPEQVLGTCSACHSPTGVAPVGKSREAAQVLALVRAENILFDVVSQSAGARASGRASTHLADARRHLAAAAEVWHTFRLDSATARLGLAREDLVAAWVALGHSAPREGRIAMPRPGGPPR